jgi:hypothetical protein
MAFILDAHRGTDVRGYGQAEVDSAAITAAVAPAGSSLLPYYFIAVAAGVTVWFITQRILGRRKS